jgi:hypothetical protein
MARIFLLGLGDGFFSCLVINEGTLFYYKIVFFYNNDTILY